jgi:large subunit ribosomal protein L15
MPLARRIPKRGFNNHRFRVDYQVVNVDSLCSKFEAGATVTLKDLLEERLVQNPNQPVKILARGDMDRALTVQATAFSEGAKRKIEAAGGKAEVI